VPPHALEHLRSGTELQLLEPLPDGIAPTDNIDHTSWTFVADQASPPSSDDGWTYLPLLQLDYNVDLAVDGTSKARGRHTIGVSASHEPEVLGEGEAAGVTLEISYDDGGTWHKVRLRPDGDEWVGTVKYPRNAEFVSLRASGWDDAGNQVEQEIIRAFGLD
jgi:hypothetical protein